MTDNRVAALEALEQSTVFDEIVEMLKAALPPSRKLSLAITNIEQGEMWAMSAYNDYLDDLNNPNRQEPPK